MLRRIRPVSPSNGLAVSISALSDRGLLQVSRTADLRAFRGFNIRSFGSWIASDAQRWRIQRVFAVSISALSDRGLLRRPPPISRSSSLVFQYPLFRIVDCFWIGLKRLFSRGGVSISALSDRGLLLRAYTARGGLLVFQYPLFRIVDCFLVLAAS